MSAPATTAAASLWRDRRFLSYWAGHSVSQFGDRITELALPLIAVGALHASANQVAWLTALTWAPSLLAIVLGAWVDRRVRKRRLMVLADLARATTLLTLPLAYLFGAVTLAQVYVVTVLTGTAAVLFTTSNSACFPRLVPRARYVDANSKLSTSQSASQVAGPAVAGVLVQALTAPVAVVADALSFLASAVLVGRIRMVEVPAADEATTSLLRRAREGLSFVVRHPVLRATLGCSTTLNFFTFVSGTGLVVLFATRGLGLSAATIGLAFGIGSTGALLGAVIAPTISRRVGLGRSAVVGAVLFPAPIAIAAAAGGPLWIRAGALAAAEFLSGLGVMLYDVNLNALQTSVTPDRVRSRVSGAYRTVNYGIRPLGAIVGGELATLAGLRATLLVGAAGGVLSLFWLLVSPIPRVRSVAPHDPEPTDDQPGRQPVPC